MVEQIPNYSETKDLTDSEFRIMLLDQLQSISTNQCNHLKHHWAITLICCAAAVTGLFNLGIAFLVIFVKGN